MTSLKAPGSNDQLPWFTIQWHITARCDQRCEHCYIIRNPEIWRRELKNELSLPDCQRIMDSLVDFCQLAGARPFMCITGGDPLLRPDFFEILRYAQHQGIRVKLMGNPHHLTLETIRAMKKLGVRGYQVSLDGLEELHDWFRQPGSFQTTIKGLQLLSQAKMRSVVMFTLSKKNAGHLPGVIKLVSELGVDVFSFARLSCDLTNAGETLDADRGLAPQEYRKLLLEIQQLAENLKAHGSKTSINLKDHLWKLLLFEQGKLALPPNPNKQVFTGCHIGRSGLTILADGTVYACRRFKSPIGMLPRESILEVYTSNKLDYYRQVEKLEKCRSCPLLYHCRGCPAVAYGASQGNFFAPDPQCWR